MNYKVLYEIGVSPMNILTWLLPLGSLLAFIIAVVYFIYCIKRKKVMSRQSKAMRIGFIFLFGFAFTGFWDEYKAYQSMKNYYNEQKCEIIEGTVTEFI